MTLDAMNHFLTMNLDNSMSFCSDPFWNSSRTWHTDCPDFTRCFHQLALHVLPAGIFLILLLPVQVLQLRSRPRGEPPPPPRLRYRLRILLALLLAALHVVLLSLEVANQISLKKYVIADILSPLALALAFSASAWLTTYVGRRGAVTSAAQFLFWFALCVCATIKLASVAFGLMGMTGEIIWRREELVIMAIYLPGVALGFVLQFWADLSPRYRELGAENNDSPEIHASFASFLLFSWMTPLLKLGWQRPLENNDLYDVTPANEAEETYVRTWTKEWEKRYGREESHIKKDVSVVRVMISSFGKWYLMATCLEVCAIVLLQVSTMSLLLLLHTAAVFVSFCSYCCAAAAVVTAVVVMVAAVAAAVLAAVAVAAVVLAAAVVVFVVVAAAVVVVVAFK